MEGLGPFGAKLKMRPKKEWPADGTTVQLHFAPPDGKPPLAIQGLVWRSDADGQVIAFVNLRSDDFNRLKTLVTTLGSNPA